MEPRSWLARLATSSLTVTLALLVFESCRSAVNDYYAPLAAPSAPICGAGGADTGATDIGGANITGPTSTGGGDSTGGQASTGGGDSTGATSTGGANGSGSAASNCTAGGGGAS